jgi:hypothetical protein
MRNTGDNRYVAQQVSLDAKPWIQQSDHGNIVGYDRGQ